MVTKYGDFCRFKSLDLQNDFIFNESWRDLYKE